MPPLSVLPLSDAWLDAESYVDSLIHFAKTSHLYRVLCGHIHILDFLTQEPDIYTSTFPEDWRCFFDAREVDELLDLFLRQDLDAFCESSGDVGSTSWRSGPAPPASLVKFIHDIRRHCLSRDFPSRAGHVAAPRISRHAAVGMKPKKIHEVENFAHYISNLSSDIAASSGSEITHIIDFGSGQNYLGRVLASKSYNKNIIAIENKQLNIDGARDMDVSAKLVAKEVKIRNKKLWREAERMRKQQSHLNVEARPELDPGSMELLQNAEFPNKVQRSGPVQYVFHEIQDGNLDSVIRKIDREPDVDKDKFMVVSLHSCGNLVHHGLRSLLLNPSVTAVAMIGCCYHLVTERLRPPTFKVPSLKVWHERVTGEETLHVGDPNGFPMSKRMEKHHIAPNVTARCMACQAPQNWTQRDCQNFFTRHYYRCLFQRLLLDYKLIEKPRRMRGVEEEEEEEDASEQGLSACPPVIIGSLPKSAHASFLVYARTAIARLVADASHGCVFESRLGQLTDSDIEAYDIKYASKKKEISITWALLAFAAGVTESLIVVDRWLFLQEHEEVTQSWVEAVFDYTQSPRNLVVCGLKEV